MFEAPGPNRGVALVLPPAVFMLLLMACGGTAAPSVDIEATVEARVAVEGAAVTSRQVV